MRQTSPHTRDLIERLREPLSLREKLTGSRDYQAILSEIGDSNETAAIIDILPFIFSRGDTAQAAAAAVHKLLLGTSLTDLPWLDSALRYSSTYFAPDFNHWNNLLPTKIDELERFGEASVSLLGLASFHLNGYVREGAIRKLSLIRTGVEVRFFIIRLNDWVSSIRDAAYQAIRSRIKPEYCRTFIASYTLLSRLEYAGRADHSEIISAVNQLLQSDECRPALLESLTSEDRFLRRASFKLALDPTKSDVQEVVRQALKDDDTVIRQRAAQTIASAFEGETLEHFRELMKRDRFMPVRREALRIAIKLNAPHVIEELHDALLDPHVSMREEARYHLKRIQPIDVAAFYRQHLSQAEGGTLYSAISGLGETGRAEDDSLLIPYTTHASSRIRSAAIKALAKVNRGAHVDLFVNAVKDEVPYVSRQALGALTQKGWWLRAESIWELFSSASHTHVKRNALSLIEKLGKWESVPLILRALTDSDEDIAAMSRAAIARWLGRVNRSFSSPTPEQLRRLRDELANVDNLIDEETREQLLFSLKGLNKGPSSCDTIHLFYRDPLA